MNKFITFVKAKIRGGTGVTEYLNHLEKVRDAAADMMVDYKKRQGDEKSAGETPHSPKFDSSKYRERFGNVLNTDNIKTFFTEEGYDRSNPDSVRKFHQEAGEIFGQEFNKLLKSEKGKGDGTVSFTGGGNGSGKSTIAPHYKGSDFVVDSTMASVDAVRKSIQAVLDNGQTPQLMFVYRPHMDAWENGVQKRTKEGGHTTPKTTFANTHANVKKNFLLLLDEFGDKVKAKAYEVDSNKPTTEISIAELRNKPTYTKEQILEDINHADTRGNTATELRGRVEGSDQGPGASESRLSKVEGRTGEEEGTGVTEYLNHLEKVRDAAADMIVDYKKRKSEVPDYEKSFGNILNADNAKTFFKDEGYDQSSPESVRRFHQLAGEKVGRIFNEWLKIKKDTGDGTVSFTGGGNGSGKSTIAPHYKGSDFVVDSTMASVDAVRKSIQAVLDNGQTPQLMFVYRPHMDAWENGVQKRTKEGGHTTPKTTFANTHANAKKNFLLLLDEFGDKIKSKIIENESGKHLKEISIAELRNKPTYTKEQILEDINHADT